MLNPTDDQVRNTKKILCIEDEYFITELYQRALERAGYEVASALNGDDGLQIAQTNDYDVILLDIMVPGINGLEILRTLKDQSKNPRFKSKIIITTNLDQDDQTRAELEEQADGYIVKAAITPKELVSFVDKLFV